MNSAQHKAEAERLIGNVNRTMDEASAKGTNGATLIAALEILTRVAQIHATLANVPDPKPTDLGPL